MAITAGGDLVTSLPLELATSVLLLVDLDDLVTCSEVCRSWRKLAHLEYLYVPYLRRKQNLFTNGSLVTVAVGRAEESADMVQSIDIRDELLQRFRHGFSASSYYSSSETLRDLALRDRRLVKQWRSGVPTRKVNLNAALDHGAVLLSVVVDPLYDLVITGNRAGEVIFWNTQTCRPVQQLNLSGEGNGGGGVGSHEMDPAISAMALYGEYLAIGTWRNTVHIFQRSSFDRTFARTSSFRVASPVISIHLTGTTCIAGCQNGELHFRTVTEPAVELLRIHTPFSRQLGQRNISIHYQRPFLFTSSKLVSQISPKVVDPDNARELWEYGVNELTIKNYSVDGDEGGGLCLVSPLRDHGELLVAWPDSSVYSLAGFKSSIIALPKCSILTEETHSRGRGVRAMAAGDGIFVTGSFDNTIDLFSHEGKLLQQFLHGSNVTALAMDPTFFVSVSEDRSVVLWDFSPPPPPPMTESCASQSPGRSVFSDADVEALVTPPSSPEETSTSEWVPHSNSRKRKAKTVERVNGNEEDEERDEEDEIVGGRRRRRPMEV